MVKWLLNVRGKSRGDTLALWINTAFWLPRRWWYERKYGDKKRAWEALMSRQPERHWLYWPFSLLRHRYGYGGAPFLDGVALIWFLAQEQGDCFPDRWLGALQKGKTGIDVGAHRGYWSLFHARHFPEKSLILLLEPDPANYFYLLGNLAHNPMSHTFIPLQVAGWRKPSLLELRHAAQEHAHGSFSNVVLEGEKGEILATSVDALVQAFALPTVDWIKIDVEGAEAAVLEGARDTLRRFGPTLWIEMHDTWEAVEALLEEAGYEIKDRIEKGAHGPYKRIGYLWAEPRAGRST